MAGRRSKLVDSLDGILDRQQQALDAERQAAQASHTAHTHFLTALGALYTAPDADPASEAVLSQLIRLIPQHWQAFEAHQSPLSTWNMLLKATETLMRVRQAVARGAENRQAYQEFQHWLEAMGVEARTRARETSDGAPSDEENEEEEDDG